MNTPSKRGRGRPPKLVVGQINQLTELSPVYDNIVIDHSIKVDSKPTIIRKPKIAIVGSYPETWEKAPYGDESWTIWGFCRGQMGKLPRCERWFELHDPMMYEKYERDVPGYKNYLKEPNVTTIEKFPKQDLETSFGSFFFSSGQVPWLLAYAISLEPEAIGLWGIEALDSYITQRFDVQHFAQICHDRGIELVIPEGCTILTARKSYI